MRNVQREKREGKAQKNRIRKGESNLKKTQIIKMNKKGQSR